MSRQSDRETETKRKKCVHDFSINHRLQISLKHLQKHLLEFAAAEKGNDHARGDGLAHELESMCRSIIQQRSGTLAVDVVVSGRVVRRQRCCPVKHEKVKRREN